MGKIITTEEITQEVKELKSSGQKIILVGGCFDIIHTGHVSFLKSAKELGGILILMLESDETVQKLKGKDRPINSQQNRAFVLSQLQTVDKVLCIPPLTGDSDYSKLVNMLKPDIIAVTEHDPYLNLKKGHAESVGGIIQVVTPRIEPYSTGYIIKKIRNKV